MSDKKPFFPMYPADFLVATAHWTNAEVGAYMRLLCHQWANGKVPSDPRRIAAIIGIHGAEFDEMWSVVGPKFKSDGNGALLNQRMETVRREVDERSKSARRAAMARWASDADAYANAYAEPHAESMPSKSKSKSNTKIKIKDKETLFARWWDEYPRKVGKRDALKRWLQVFDEMPDVDVMIEKLHDQARNDRSWKEGFVPLPATYLNQGRWDDEVDRRETADEKEARKRHEQTMRDLGIA